MALIGEKKVNTIFSAYVDTFFMTLDSLTWQKKDQKFLSKILSMCVRVMCTEMKNIYIIGNYL